MRYGSNKERLPTVTEKGIYGFFGEYRFLSNFHVCNVTLDGLTYKSSEAAYMAGKTTDKAIKMRFAAIDEPKEAKKLGREITMIPEWDDYKVLHMTRVVYAKFAQNRDIALKLFQTYDKYLEETNNWNDLFWGADELGQGKNMLGKVLMHVREILPFPGIPQENLGKEFTEILHLNIQGLYER